MGLFTNVEVSVLTQICQRWFLDAQKESVTITLFSALDDFSDFKIGSTSSNDVINPDQDHLVIIIITEEKRCTKPWDFSIVLTGTPTHIKYPPAMLGSSKLRLVKKHNATIVWLP